MKKFKKLIPALCMLLISAVMLGSSTFAWFSMNKTVTASGMQVKAQAEGSIVITAGTLPAAGLKTTDYNFNETTSTALYASTHDANYATYASGLKRVKNAENINLETGIKKYETASLEYETAANTATILYYKDYTVYIAGDGQAFTNQTLTISLAGTIGNNKTINKAVSVDFYGTNVTSTTAAIVSSTNYLGTLNIAGTKNGADEKSITAYTTFTTPTIASIPQANGSAAYGVVMRVYYDGALIETAGTNAFTAYKAAEGNAEAGKYYYTDKQGTSVATVATGASVEGLFVVDSSASTYTYAKTVEVADLDSVTLTAKFVVASGS